MNAIAGIPYVEAEFDKEGSLKTAVDVPAGVTDLFVISHGWNNDADRARELYTAFFESFNAVLKPGDLAGRSLAVVGVIWPSKQFDELVAVAGNPDASGGSASLDAAHAQSLEALERKLDTMKQFFTAPAQQQALDEAKTLLPDLEEKATARRDFVGKIRSLLEPSAADPEDASQVFFKDDGNELMKNLKVDEADLDDEVAGSGGSASLPLGVGTTATVSGGAAGLTDILTGFKAAAMNVLNFTTYFEMKTRAGTVGKIGVAPLIDQLASRVQRIHLIGHSFGGRVVAATAASSSTDKIKSMSLLQTAFSHNGFSQTMHGFFRTVVDQRRVSGPILVTHTKNDKAVGVAYPLASRISGDRTAAFGDENDVFGGLGRNGTQKMEGGESIFGKLLPAGAGYQFVPGKFHNLESSDFIKGHSDITGKEVAYAVSRIVAT